MQFNDNMIKMYNNNINRNYSWNIRNDNNNSINGRNGKNVTNKINSYIYKNNNFQQNLSKIFFSNTLL